MDAPHLDFTDCRSFIRTVAKHPQDGGKSGDVGHAWIYLRGIVNGQELVLEGGHSGETGRIQARYLDGIMNNIDFGFPTPPSHTFHARYEPNPVSYLWAVQNDGFFQSGSGGHQPTFALKVPLTPDQFWNILHFIEQYEFSNYSLQGRQCTSFVVEAAALASLQLECHACLQFPSVLDIHGEELRLWTDPCYSML